MSTPLGQLVRMLLRIGFVWGHAKWTTFRILRTLPPISLLQDAATFNFRISLSMGIHYSHAVTSYTSMPRSRNL